MKTYSARPKDIVRSWYILDASEAPLGRVATMAARLLIGKDKATFTPHIDGGDFVIIINAANLIVTGNKKQDKQYYRHSGFPGGLSSRKLAEVLELDATKAIIHAVRGMLPANKLRAARLKRLKIYLEAEHQHSAQKPTTIKLFKESK